MVLLARLPDYLSSVLAAHVLCALKVCEGMDETSNDHCVQCASPSRSLVDSSFTILDSKGGARAP